MQRRRSGSFEMNDTEFNFLKDCIRQTHKALADHMNGIVIDTQSLVAMISDLVVAKDMFEKPKPIKS